MEPGPVTRTSTVRASLRARAARRPTLVDIAMMAVAVIRYVARTTTPGWAMYLTNIVLWCALWTAWKVTKSSLLGAAVSLAVLALMFLGPQWQVAFDISRGCMTSRAELARAAHAPEYDRDYDLIEFDGRCGILRYGSLSTELVRVDGAEPFDPQRILVAKFSQSGLGGLTTFGKGFVYSPDGRPSCRDVATHQRPFPCNLHDDGGGWYSYQHGGDFN